MLAYYAFGNAAALSEQVGLMKIGEGLRSEYNLVDAPMPERLAALLAQLDRSKQSMVVTLGETCLRPFDRLDDMIRRSVTALFAK
jgi:hypothetical protein